MSTHKDKTRDIWEETIYGITHFTYKKLKTKMKDKQRF